MIVDLRPVILCGGSGTRLWPLSNQTKPKQFHNLLGDQSLLQLTVLRATALTARTPVIVTSARHVPLVQRQLGEIGVEPACIIAEPHARNTAPGIALAAQWLRRNEDDLPMWVLPSDHRIADVAALRVAADDACRAARKGYLATFGIRPTMAHTGYGYIRRGEPVPGLSRLFLVAGFQEKPDPETALHYLNSGLYEWNSGMFVFLPQRYLDELAAYAPAVFELAAKAFCGGRELSNLYRPSAAYGSCPSISIDYAVMEPTRHAVVAPLRAEWSDIGSWAALWEVSERDAQGNVADPDVLMVGSTNCLVRGSKTTAVVGLDNVIVVETRDGLLVCSRTHAESVKEVQALLAQRAQSSRPVAEPFPPPMEGAAPILAAGEERFTGAELGQ
jgi:mannose-1-phosphate guanylyltransferase/mannose-6-phosphate isomerase